MYKPYISIYVVFDKTYSGIAPDVTILFIVNDYRAYILATSPQLWGGD